MPHSSSIPIDHLPTPTILCSLSGTILNTNNRADKLLGTKLTGRLIDNIIDFSKSDLSDCRCFADVIAVIRERSVDLNNLTVLHNQAPISHLNLFFNFTTHEDIDAVIIGIQDYTERKKLLEAFEYKQNLLDNIVTTSNDALIVFDRIGCIELFSPAAEVMFGKTSTEMIIEDIYTLFDNHCHQQLNQIIDHLNTSDNSNEVLLFEDLQPINPKGKVFPASITFSRSQKDRDLLYFMVISDKSLFQQFINSVNDAYIKTNDEGKIIDFNNKAEALFNYDRNTLLNKHISFLGIRSSNNTQVVSNVSNLVDSKDHIDYFANSRRGNELTLNLTVWPQEINNIRLNNLIIRDISQKKIAERQLIISAYTDSLTSLANRACFNKSLAEHILLASQTKKPFALLAIDLDKFKSVNDNLGHDYGDELLKVVSKRLTACVRDFDLVSRMGGDEFTIIIKEYENLDLIQRIADRILRSLRREFSLKDRIVAISSSLGIALYPHDANNAEDLYKSADMAMYAAKRAGKDTFRFFSKEMFQEYERTKLIENGLLAALENNELFLHYQPKISYTRHQVVGFEALLRWNSPELGPVSPAEFIPVAEDFGVIVDLTKWVLKNAIHTMKRWRIEHENFVNKQYTLAINISADHFKQDIFNDIKTILVEEEYPPNLLEIEITEGTLLEKTDDTLEAVQELNKFGVKISMDDFGTGYSSLQYLKNFSLDSIKIDRSFVKEIHNDSCNFLIIETIIAIANRLELDLIAEGVESLSEVEHLVNLGCDIFQGFYYFKPLPEDQVVQAVERFEASKAYPA